MNRAAVAPLEVHPASRAPRLRPAGRPIEPAAVGGGQSADRPTVHPARVEPFAENLAARARGLGLTATMGHDPLHCTLELER